MTSVAGIIVVPTLLSCVSTTGTKTNLTAAELAKVRSTAILVESKHPLSVRVARDNLTNTGAALFGLVGAALEASYRASKDTEHEENIRRVLSNFDLAEESARAFRDKFGAVKAFPVVEIVQTEDARILQAKGFDAVFKETIDEWGLRLCAGGDNVRVGFDVHMQLIALQSELVVWERDELFMDGPCRPLADFQTNKDLLRASLKMATETLAGKTANEIAFP